MDNRTTAMTGHQPTPALGYNLDGTAVPELSIPEIVKACGVKFIEEADPYDLKEFISILRSAGKHAAEENGGIAVVISRRPCLMDRRQPKPDIRRKVRVTETCKGCNFCCKQFECPAIQPLGEKEPVRIDEAMCTGCGVCVSVCPHHALEIAE